MKLAATQQLHAYWRRVKKGRGAPERNDIDPGAIRDVLADTFILEFERAQGFPMRVVGTRTQALFQRELRGSPFLELWRRDHRGEIGGLIESVADEAQPFLVGAAGGPTGVAAIDIEVLLLPLRHHGATHARILGSCALGSPPPWLGLLAIAPMALTSLRALRECDASAPRPAWQAGEAGRPDGERRGHLVVYSTRP